MKQTFKMGETKIIFLKNKTKERAQMSISKMEKTTDFGFTLIVSLWSIGNNKFEMNMFKLSSVIGATFARFSKQYIFGM